MPGEQSYQDRVNLRPAYSTLKNRKKTIRQRRQNHLRRHAEGLINSFELEVLLEKCEQDLVEAKMLYARDPSTIAGSEKARDRLRSRLWWQKRAAARAEAGDRRGGMCGDDSCAGAQPGGPCNCQCDGVFHGAAFSGSLAVSDAEVDEAIETARQKAVEYRRRVQKHITDPTWTGGPTDTPTVCAREGCPTWLRSVAVAKGEIYCVEHRDPEPCGLCGTAAVMGTLRYVEGLWLCEVCHTEVAAGGRYEKAEQ